MKKIGLTGATGVLGKSILASQWPETKFIPFKGDIRKSEEIKQWLEPDFDSIIHLAALVPTNLVEADPDKAFDINATGTMRLLEAIENRPWIFIASSSHVYASSSEPLKESSPLKPVSIYGRTKLKAEELAASYQGKLSICIGRIFSFSAPTQANSYFLPSLIKKIKTCPKGGSLEIRGLHGTRDFLTTSQIGEAIKGLSKNRSTGIYNIGTGSGVKLLDLALALKKKLGRDDVQIVPLEIDINHLVADVSKLEKEGIDLKFDLDRFLQNTIN